MSLINVTVKCSNTDKASFSVDATLTVGEFKDVVAREMGVEVCSQRLIFKGRVLKDELTLEHYGEFLFLFSMHSMEKGNMIWSLHATFPLLILFLLNRD